MGPWRFFSPFCWRQIQPFDFGFLENFAYLFKMLLR
jgi:hypothetical protein